MARVLIAAMLTAFAAIPVAAGPAANLDAVRDHLRRGMLRTAAEELAGFLREHPDSAEAFEALAGLRLAKGEVLPASEAAFRAVELGNGESRIWSLWGQTCLEVARSLRDEGLPKERYVSWCASAEKAFRTVLENDPEDPDVHWRFGLSREWQGDHGVAEQFYDLQIERFPQHPAGYARMGRLFANRANWVKEKPEETRRLRDQAYEFFRLGIEKAGEDPELLFVMGGVREEDETPGLALSCYLRAAEAGPEFRRAWDRAAEQVDAETVLYPLAKQVLAKHPTAAVPAMWAGHCANRRAPGPGEKPWEKHAEALRWVLPALEVHCEHEGLYKEAYLAAQKLMGDDPARALDPARGVAAFEKIHEAWRWSGDAANNLGFWFREQKKYDLSLAWYLKATERAPDNQDILNDTGLIYLFHFPRERGKGLPFFEKTVALVAEGDQKPERGYWDALENLCKHYTEVDPQPEKVLAFAKMRYEVTKGVPPYNMSQVSEQWAKKARKALGR